MSRYNEDWSEVNKIGRGKKEVLQKNRQSSVCNFEERRKRFCKK